MHTIEVYEARVWDKSVRIFHWVNVIAVMGLLVMGFLMLYRKDLGIASLEARVMLKTVHVWIGYIFVANLSWRLLWGFVGGHYGRWSIIFPSRGFTAQLKTYIASIRTAKPQSFLGHNPLGRLAILFMFLLLLIQAVTGLVRAGTDIYYPPFGGQVLEYIAAPGVDVNSIQPYVKTGTDAESMEALKVFKKPFGVTHLYVAYILMLMIFLHVFIVIKTEIREGEGLISAMFTGKKQLRSPPVDGSRG